MNSGALRSRWIRAGVAGVLLWSLGSAVASRAEEAGTTVDDLAWMAGCWQQVDERSTQEECWLPPRGDTMLGVNRTTRAGGGGSFEFIRITTDEKGIAYIASPSGQKTTSFHLTASEPGMAVFENPEHDFPQRLIYRHDEGVLRVRVEAQDGEKVRGFDLRLERTTSWP